MLQSTEDTTSVKARQNGSYMATGDYPAHAETDPKLQATPEEVEKHEAVKNF